MPWAKAIGTRHRMVHDYDVIDYDVVWDTIADDFPPLVAALERALAGEPR
ncbi:MAG TPA: HepT-like ribonuclease domain-containing protein [Methylomirabilota bacterium]|nr:HepT-like ribonuclease domain-containing protein [Methylomirabilota bacterium]